MRANGTLRQRQLGRELRRLREEAGLTLDEAAPQLDWSTSKLSRIEIGQQSVDVHGVRSMLDLYDVGGDRWTEIIDLTREARQKGWWHAYGISGQGYLGLETDATAVHDYQLAYIPGLLQTEGYMRTLFRTSPPLRAEADVNRDVQVRLRRQRRLTELPILKLVAIVDGSFTLLGFGEADEPEVAYVEHTAGAAHLEKDVEVSTCKLVFDRLRSESLSPQDSVTLVERLAAEL